MEGNASPRGIHVCASAASLRARTPPPRATPNPSNHPHLTLVACNHEQSAKPPTNFNLSGLRSNDYFVLLYIAEGKKKDCLGVVVVVAS